MLNGWRSCFVTSVAACVVSVAVTAKAQSSIAPANETVVLTPPIAAQRSFGFSHDLKAVAHTCTDIARSLPVNLVPAQPPQTLKISAEAKLEMGQPYCEMNLELRNQAGKSILNVPSFDFEAQQGLMSDTTLVLHRFGGQQYLIVNTNGVSLFPISYFYIVRFNGKGEDLDPSPYFTSGENISFSISEDSLTINSKFFDGTTGDREPPCCFKPASFVLSYDPRTTRFSPHGDKVGLDLFRQLTANGARKHGELGPLPSDQTGDTTPADITPVIEPNALGLQVSDWKTYWIVDLPAGTANFCVPAVSFKVTNSSDHDIDGVQITASFLDEKKKETFGAATKVWAVTSGDAPLPPGYSRTANFHSTRGFKLAPNVCDAANRPTISVRVQAKELGTMSQATLGASQVASELRNYQPGQ